MKKKKASKKKKFERDLVERGEAAEPDEEGKLPPGATHEIVGRNEKGELVIRRRRFSIK
ncbi:MAG TPA: hypothetical protein VM779_01315 [Thermoanaerobaculia bacterium]|nr:hypothetical protein [Thermoanaerobaculia bacterium]